MSASNIHTLLSRVKWVAERYGAKYWFFPALVLLIAYDMQRAIGLLGFDLHHDAFMFDAATRLLNGEVPFRDFFYQYNLGTVVLHMLALKAYGVYITSLKLITMPAYALIAVLIYVCAAMLNRPWHGLGMALIWSTLSPFYMPSLEGYHPWSTVYMMASVMLGTVFLLIATKNKQAVIYAGLAGICFSLAFWFKQVAGLQILFVLMWMLLNVRRAAVGEEIARQCRKIFIGFALGGVIAALPFATYLIAHHLLYDWWRSAFVFNRYFALTGHYSSSLYFFLRAVFPVARDLGYVSAMWALLPLYLLLMLVGTQKGGKLLPLRTDEWSRRASLLLMLGLAGWIEYFPMPHSFHTQLFMAPTFVLIALGMNKASQEANGWRSWGAMAFISLMMIVTLYETVQHLKGYRAKTAETRVAVEAEEPAKGLKLLPEYAVSFEQFYQAVKKAQQGREELPVIPLSGDPLRATFPFSHKEKTTFKMGVDWTWPNELVEPGFNQRLYDLINKRKALIYADSVLAIPGYIPVALLEMPSPLGVFHTLYIPSADAEVPPPTYQTINAIYLLKNGPEDESFRDFRAGVNNKNDVRDSENKFPVWEPQAGCAAPIYKQEVMLPFNVSGIDYANVDQLHVSIISDSEIPHSITPLEYEKFMVPALAGFSEHIAADSFWEKQRNGQYGLKPSLEEKDWLYLARFFLYRGKLKELTNSTRFASTLAQSEMDRPFIVSMAKMATECPRVIWAEAHKDAAITQEGQAQYLAIPTSRLIDGGPMTFYVQVVMKDGTTLDRYLRYGYEGTGMSGEN